MGYTQHNPFSRKSSPCNQNDKETITETRKKPGGSNAGKYPNVPKDEFCGPAGGAPAGTFPVNTPERISAAIMESEHAPNPAGIKSCAEDARKKKGEGMARRSSSPVEHAGDVKDHVHNPPPPKKKSNYGRKAPSRKSSSPLNNTGWGAWDSEEDYNAADDIMRDDGEGDYGTQKLEDQNKGLSRNSSSPLNADMALVDIEEGKGESNYEATHGGRLGNMGVPSIDSRTKK